LDSFALDKLTLANTVHIYQASLDPPQSQVEQLAAMLSQDELDHRKAAWKAPELKIKTGVLARYRNSVTSASKGSVLR